MSPLSRRDFLSFRFLRRDDAVPEEPPAPARPDLATQRPTPPSDPASPGRRPIPMHRPPGAVPEADFLADCTRCGDCIRACPHGAIRLAPAHFGAATGTPYINPTEAACLMCPDTPCITACRPAVLRPERPRRMATAIIQPRLCLAWTGRACSACHEQCPVPGAIQVPGGRPRVVAAVCTGCGVCHHVCPAQANAVVIMPRREGLGAGG